MCLMENCEVDFFLLRVLNYLNGVDVCFLSERCVLIGYCDFYYV